VREKASSPLTLIVLCVVLDATQETVMNIKTIADLKASMSVEVRAAWAELERLIAVKRAEKRGAK
jgi:hypothetical protein